MHAMFDRRISLGNWLTIGSMLLGFGAQWGAFQSAIGDIDRRLAVVEAGHAELRKDTRVVDALNRIAVIENNVLWIRSDVADIKAKLDKRGAQ